MAPQTPPDLIELPGEQFAMGSDDFYPDEGPIRKVDVDGFSVLPYPVTNQAFASFVADTGYVTEAEYAPDPDQYPGAIPELLIPGALVFTMTKGPIPLHDFSQWWAWTPGACWRHPTGPESTIESIPDHPVVQVSHADAVAYCNWAGLVLPTEAEWEYAARGGLDSTRFVWGDHDPQETEPLANTWQGRFPYENTELDGWTRTSPVGTYPANEFGLYDMAGNVWEWTDDWYSAASQASPSCCAPTSGATREGSFDPSQPEIAIPRKVVKGGSHLCTPQYCYRYRPAARQPQMIDTATSHIGFRGIRRSTG